LLKWRAVRSVVVVATLVMPAVALAQPSPPPDQQQPAPDQPAPPQPAPPQPEQPAPPPAQPTPAPPEQPVEVITVKGRVINALGRGIRGAHVTNEAGEELGRTDRHGYFVVKVPRNETLVIDVDGYETGLATATGTIIDDVVLLDTKTATETIEVKGEAPAAAPGAAQLDRKELQRVPGTGGDVVRALTVMPGVVNLQVPLGYSGVVIRGSSPQDSKILVDGFEIPVLYHNIGFRAVLPAEAIDTLDYIPGGFDVSYGRASSGIVALTTRPGSDQRSTQAEVSFIDGGLLAQGPAGKDTTYMIGLRRSTIDLILPSILPASLDLSLTTVPSYYDEQFRIDHRFNSKWRLSLSSVGTIDTFELYATKDTDAGTKRFFNRTEFLRLTGIAHYHDGPWTANLALSGLLPEFIFEAGLYQKIDVTQPTVTPRVEVIRTAHEALGLEDVEWRAGAEAQVGRSSLDLALPHETREGEDQGAYDPRDISTKFKGHVWLPDFAQWTSVSASFDPRVRFTGGLRLDEYGRPGDIAIQPRGELKVKLTKSLTARLSSGAYTRPPEFQSEVLATNISAEHSVQNIFGLQFEPHEGLRVQAQTYYTDRTKLITTNADGTLGNEGRGKTYGGELLASYRGGPWFGWLSYSYSRSTRVDHPGDPERLFTYDQPHSLNAAGSWKGKHWQLGGRFQLYSGLPYTPVTGAVFDSDRNLYIPIYAPPNSARAPIHHQLDVRVDYFWNWGPAQMTAFLDVQNVYMNDSVVTYFYGYDYSQETAFKSIPIIPSIGLRGVL
jgi:hypothetical protein